VAPVGVVIVVFNNVIEIEGNTTKKRRKLRLPGDSGLFKQRHIKGKTTK
jgi:hypothetical protein